MKQNRKPPRGLDTGGGMNDDAGLGEVKRLRLCCLDLMNGVGKDRGDELWLPGSEDWRRRGWRRVAHCLYGTDGAKTAEI